MRETYSCHSHLLSEGVNYPEQLPLSCLQSLQFVHLRREIARSLESDFDCGL